DDVHGGFASGPTVVQAEKYNTLLPDFKNWFEAIDGFGEYLRTFFEHYSGYFEVYSEEHALVYTQLHKEFSTSLELSIVQWIAQLGLTEDDFGLMLREAIRRGDDRSDEIVGVLAGMLDYQLWVVKIFALKRAALLRENPQDEKASPEEVSPEAEEALFLSVAVPEGMSPGQEVQVTCPDGQSLLVAVPEGLAEGQLFHVSYVPLAVLEGSCSEGT
ncbi:unnamed protein product, partial [Polarella glacialis]